MLDVDSKPETLAEQEFASENILGVFFAELVSEPNREKTCQLAIDTPFQMNGLTL
jgi:hypothetical protein